MIPPRKDAAIRPPPGLKTAHPRRRRRPHRRDRPQGLEEEAHYHRRSLAETAMCRYKTIIGPGLKARTLENQKAEAAVAVRCLNRFTALGMPRSIRIA